MDERHEDKSAEVPEAKQAEEIRSMADWVERAVWTDRMLQALRDGVKGGVWFSLIDKVYLRKNLEAAFRKVRSNKGSAGVDHKTIEQFELKLEAELSYLEKTLRDGTYRPMAVKRVYIPKPGKPEEKRPLGIPSVRDRVVQTAVRNVIEPIFEKDFAEHSYGFRPRKGAKTALKRVWHLLNAEEGQWVVDADIKSYFDTIDHGRLMKLVGYKIADSRVLGLLEQFLTQQVRDEWSTWESERGTPQGGVISPLLANIYLDPLDHLMASKGFRMTRYADDFVVQCKSREEAELALALVGEWMDWAGLTLHPEKTRIVDMRQKGASFVFLGYHFQRTSTGLKKWASEKAMKRTRDRIRELTPRTNGSSLEGIIQRLNRSLKGFYEYFKHGRPFVFTLIDGWVRKRLRSILRARRKRRGSNCRVDNFRWPNAYFRQCGYVSLADTHSAELAALGR